MLISCDWKLTGEPHNGCEVLICIIDGLQEIFALLRANHDGRLREETTENTLRVVWEHSVRLSFDNQRDDAFFDVADERKSEADLWGTVWFTHTTLLPKTLVFDSLGRFLIERASGSELEVLLWIWVGMSSCMAATTLIAASYGHRCVFRKRIIAWLLKGSPLRWGTIFIVHLGVTIKSRGRMFSKKLKNDRHILFKTNKLFTCVVNTACFKGFSIQQRRGDGDLKEGVKVVSVTLTWD